MNKKHNTSRKEVIARYENIVRKWDNCPNQTLKRLLPSKYEEIKEKLRLLKEGYSYTITDKTDELKTAIAYIGGQIPRVNYSIKGLIDINNGITWREAEEITSRF